MIVSVVICTRNRCAALRETLQSLHSVPIPDGLSVELIIVDNGSTDETPTMVKSISPHRFETKYLFEATPGQAGARNRGMRAAQGEVIVFTDDDVRPEPGWLQAITEPIVDNRFDALAGTVKISPKLIRPWMTARHRAWLGSTEYLDPTAPSVATGANMSFARHVLEKVPAFDEDLGPGRLGFWDDTLFFSQLKQTGYRIGMATDSVIEHHFDASRLSHDAFLARARNEGMSVAHVAWHWNHETRFLPSVRAVRREFELRLKRRLYRWPYPDGIAVWEMDLVKAIAFLRHFEAICHQPRAYEKFGASKLR